MMQVQISPHDTQRGEFTLLGLRELGESEGGEMAAMRYDFAMAVVAMGFRAELLRRQALAAEQGLPLPTTLAEMGSGITIGEAAQAYAAEGGQIRHVSTALWAIQHAQRQIFRASSVPWNQTLSPTPDETFPQLPGWGDAEPAGAAIIPWVVATVVGVAAIGGVSWYGVEAKRVEATVAVESARLTAETQRYAEQVSAALATGQVVPPPPAAITRAAIAEQGSGLVTAGLGILLGGGIVWGLLSRKKTPERRANPARRITGRRRARRRKTPTTTTAAPKPRRRPKPKRAAPAKAAPKRTNPSKPRRKATRKAAPPKPRRKAAPKRTNPSKPRRKATRKTAPPKPRRKTNPSKPRRKATRKTAPPKPRRKTNPSKPRSKRRPKA